MCPSDFTCVAINLSYSIAVSVFCFVFALGLCAAVSFNNASFVSVAVTARYVVLLSKQLINTVCRVAPGYYLLYTYLSFRRLSFLQEKIHYFASLFISKDKNTIAADFSPTPLWQHMLKVFIS